MTRKEFAKECKEIMASELDRVEQAKRVGHLSTTLIEDTIEKTPEMRDLRKRWAKAEKILAGHKGYSFCPDSSTWYPEQPPGIKALNQEYLGLFHQRVQEAALKVMNGKTG